MSFETRQLLPMRTPIRIGRLKVEFHWSGYWYWGHYWLVDSSDGYHGYCQGFGLFVLRFLRRYRDPRPLPPQRSSTYARPECVFCYCPEPFKCRNDGNCRYKVRR